MATTLFIAFSNGQMRLTLYAVAVSGRTSNTSKLLSMSLFPARRKSKIILNFAELHTGSSIRYNSNPQPWNYENDYYATACTGSYITDRNHIQNNTRREPQRSIQTSRKTLKTLVVGDSLFKEINTKDLENGVIRLNESKQ